MAASRPAYEVLPFPPGAGPFHVKGVAYRGHLEYVEAFLPGGVAACSEAIHDEALRRFWDQRFLAASWYDVFPLVSIGFTCARLLGQPVDGFLRVRSRYQAEQDINGVYKMMTRLASAEAVTSRLTRLVASYFDFGDNDVRTVSPKHVEATRRGVPSMVAAWSQPILETYIDYALSINGAKDPRVASRPFKRDGVSHGVETVTMSIEISWG